MKHFVIIIAFITTYLAGLSQGIQRFKLPVFLQAEKIDTIPLFSEEYLNGSNAMYIGKFRFTDTIHFDEKIEKRKLMTEEEAKWERHDIFDGNSFTSDGLQIVPDYNSSIALTVEWMQQKRVFFPVYIINETSEPKIFIGLDRNVFAIQEAVDTIGYSKWYAIESPINFVCSNGYYKRKINPGEFIVFGVAKYTGLNKTDMRVRLKIGENTFVSKSFKGFINLNQFRIQKKDYIYNTLKRYKFNTPDFLFYGAESMPIK